MTLPGHDLCDFSAFQSECVQLLPAPNAHFFKTGAGFCKVSASYSNSEPLEDDHSGRP